MVKYIVRVCLQMPIMIVLSRVLGSRMERNIALTCRKKEGKLPGRSSRRYTNDEKPPGIIGIFIIMST